MFFDDCYFFIPQPIEVIDHSADFGFEGEYFGDKSL